MQDEGSPSPITALWRHDYNSAPARSQSINPPLGGQGGKKKQGRGTKTIGSECKNHKPAWRNFANFAKTLRPLAVKKILFNTPGATKTMRAAWK